MQVNIFYCKNKYILYEIIVIYYNKNNYLEDFLRWDVVGIKRIFLIVLDSLGIGAMPDASDYGDNVSCNTLRSISKSKFFKVENMKKLGLFNIDGVNCGKKELNPIGTFARMKEKSKGKDTTIGHWEIAGIESETPLPTYPDGFPAEIISEFERATGRKVLCNKPYSGTEVIKDYGQEHMRTGALIVYTSADSVFQVAAHEDIVSPQKLYEYCKIARDLLKGKNAVGRVIARPFVGEYPNFKRTANRHDFSLEPPQLTMLDQLVESGKCVLSVGKIVDIFAAKGITEFIRTKGNKDGIERIKEFLNKAFEGLCFVNLVDFDMLYGHRNDVDGYAKALTEFDKALKEIILGLKSEDLLIITADHGCDPSDESTDHSREYTPLLMYGEAIKKGVNLGTRQAFSDIGATILDYFEIEQKIKGKSMLNEVAK